MKEITVSKYFDSLRKWDGHGSFDLNTMHSLLSLLEQPQDSVPSIHVAGTNGKGSVCLLLGRILGYWGKDIGCLLSPPLGNALHRYIVNGLPLEEQVFSKLCGKIAEVCKLEGLNPSQFEVYTALAFLAFQGLQYQIIEVGLGGRLDASNVLNKKLCSIITSIGYDHQHLLGNSIEQIAAEKAGIIVGHEPVIVGQMSEQAVDIIKTIAKQKGSIFYCYGKDFRLDFIESKESAYRYEYSDRESRFELISSLPPMQQLSNLAIAIFQSSLMGVPTQVIVDSLNGFSLPGRFETILHSKNQFIFDAAHNLDATKSLIQVLDSKELRKLDCYYGVYRDKEWELMIELLSPYIVNWNPVCLDEQRGVSVTELTGQIKKLGGKLSQGLFDNQIFENPVLVTGSISTVNYLKSLMNIHYKTYW